MYVFKHDEDEVGSIQLLPIEWHSYCLAQFEAMERHVEEHASPEGTGITKMYKLPSAATLPLLDMTQAQFVELMSQHGKRFDRITSTLGDVDEILGIRCIGFGSGMDKGEEGWGNKGLIGELDDDRVRTIWGRLWTSDEREREILADMLMAASTHQHLLVVNWNSSGIADLRSHDDIMNYFGN